MINKDQIADDVASSLNVSKSDARKILTAGFESISKALRGGNDVRIPGLGTFAVKDTAARTGRNPITGEEVAIAAGRRVSFKVAADLKKGL